VTFFRPDLGEGNIFYPVKPCDAAFSWLRCGKLAFAMLLRTHAFSHFPGFLSDLCELCGENCRFYKKTGASTWIPAHGLAASGMTTAGGMSPRYYFDT